MTRALDRANIQVGDAPLSHRNMIINGAMLVAQRGTSAVTADASYPVDRFLMLNNSNGTFSAQQVAEAPSGFKNSLKVTITGADTDLSTTQRLLVSYYIEGQDFISPAFGTSSAKSITLSFQVRSSLTGTFSGSLQNDDQDRSFPFEYTISSANTWESKSITISGETSGTWLTTNGVGARLRFSLGEGTNQQGTANTWGNANYFGTSSGTSLIGTNGATWQITGVQLELGDNATPFEHRSYDDELSKCFRYFQKITYSQGFFGGSGQIRGTSTGKVFISHEYPKQMRTTPTTITLPTIGQSSGNMTFLNGEAYPSTHGSLEGTEATADHVWFTFTGFSSLGSSYQNAWAYVIDDANFTFDAEL